MTADTLTFEEWFENLVQYVNGSIGDDLSEVPEVYLEDYTAGRSYTAVGDDYIGEDYDEDYDE